MARKPDAAAASERLAVGAAVPLREVAGARTDFRVQRWDKSAVDWVTARVAPGTVLTPVVSE